MSGHRQIERTYSTRARGPGAVFPQWLRGNAAGPTELLRPEIRYRPHRSTKKRSDRVSQLAVRLAPTCQQPSLSSDQGEGPISNGCEDNGTTRCKSKCSTSLL